MSTMLFFMIFVVAIAAGITNGKLCNTYEVSSTNEHTVKFQGDNLGYYKLQTGKQCNGYPTFKHTLYDRYMYVGDGGLLLIGDKESCDSCTMSVKYLYQLKNALAPSNAGDSGWYYYDWVHNSWQPDRHTKVTCVCHVIVITTRAQSTISQHKEMMGVYLLDDEHKCGGRATYRHYDLQKDRYLFVDRSSKQWAISNKHDHHDCSNVTNQPYCAYNPMLSAPFIATTSPRKQGWLVYDKNDKRWRTDSSMTLHCLTEPMLNIPYKQ